VVLDDLSLLVASKFKTASVDDEFAAIRLAENSLVTFVRTLIEQNARYEISIQREMFTLSV
jgi:hypothetical protein